MQNFHTVQYDVLFLLQGRVRNHTAIGDGQQFVHLRYFGICEYAHRSARMETVFFLDQRFQYVLGIYHPLHNEFRLALFYQLNGFYSAVSRSFGVDDLIILRNFA